MEITTAWKKAREKGLKGTIAYCFENKKKIQKEMKSGKVYRILLLTNRDSDNVGDQVIEACDIGLIETVMNNLNVESGNYEINSQAASLVSQKYLSTKNEKLLENVEKQIKKSDIVIFGGAPMFNYDYQNFYERTAVVLELAQKHDTPVIFSAIGIEGYSEENAKCQRLKKTLNFDCVKQITTRDDFDSLQKYKESEALHIEKVSDPAVFSSQIFRNQMSTSRNGKKKKIGLFILRSNGFKDNKINFSRDASAKMWVNLIRELKKKGYDYELLTSGHFADEAFIDYLVRKHGVSLKNCAFNMNTPDRLIEKISSYDAVVSCRLHPSIISFALDVPSVGVVWNPKVIGFYESIGYQDRIVHVENTSVEAMVEKIEKAMEQGVNKDREYLVSVYHTLFRGIQKSLNLHTELNPYSYEELVNKIPSYEGTSESEQDEKIKRKFRRTYGKYNDLFEKNAQNKKIINSLKAQIQELEKQENGVE